MVALVLLAGCASSYKEMFLNRSYREHLSLTDQELINLQFFTSTDILVQYESPAGKASIFLPAKTPGVVTAVGPDWLKVSFREGGANIPFVVDQSAPYDTYYVATELPGTQGFHMLKDQAEKVFYYDGTAYQVIYGDKAHLLVDGRALQKLMKKRIPTKGRRVRAK